MLTKPLHTETPWLRIEVDESDRALIGSATCRKMLEQMLIIRTFEEKLLEMAKEGILHGPAHSSIGQEAVAVGCMLSLGSSDKINGTHRMHHQFLAKVLNHVTAKDYDPATDEFSPEMQDVVMRTLAEILGLSPGFTGGRGGSMHLKWDACGVFGSNAIVGGNPPHAVGYAMAEKLRGSNNIAVTFFGDGAIQNGSSYESMNLAALYNLPVVFVCENNLYAVSTHVREQTREQRLSARGLGLGVPGLEVDGMNPVAMHAAMSWAKDQISNKAGPVLIEALTYRFFHQSGPLTGSAFGYRDKDEEQQWNDRDPLKNFPETLVDSGVIDEGDVARYRQRAADIVDTAISALVEDAADTKSRRIIPSLWPSKDTVEHGIRGDLEELSNVSVREVEDTDPKQTKTMKYIEAVSLAARNAMEHDDSIIILGEDVHRLRGGTSGATRGIAEKFPDRLIATPICENGFTGLGVGAALNGLRPIVEIMYPDFALVAADQLFNQAGKVRHMFGGDHPLPLVVRSRVSAGTGYGSQHSMDSLGLFALYPGWRIVAPSTPYDYVGLFNAAIRCNDPVLVIEYQNLFQNTGPVPVDDLDYIIPFGSAKVVREGSDCTVLTYAGVLPMTLEAIESSGVDAEVIDLRTLDPMGIDWQTIGASIRKTNRLVVSEQTTRGTSLGAHIVKAVQEQFFDWLDAEIVHVSGAHSSPVVSKVLEQAALAGPAEIVVGLKQVML
ncbi:MAG: MFS transporter [marine bacterium B5-7]|nr:MAG: MFS transporter [marine bacterium B5-7]